MAKPDHVDTVLERMNTPPGDRSGILLTMLPRNAPRRLPPLLAGMNAGIAAAGWPSPNRSMHHAVRYTRIEKFRIAAEIMAYADAVEEADRQRGG